MFGGSFSPPQACWNCEGCRDWLRTSSGCPTNCGSASSTISRSDTGCGTSVVTTFCDRSPRCIWDGSPPMRWKCERLVLRRSARESNDYPGRMRRTNPIWFPVGGGPTALTRNAVRREYVGSSWTSTQAFDDENVEPISQPVARHRGAVNGAYLFRGSGVDAFAYPAAIPRPPRLRPESCTMGFPGTGRMVAILQPHASGDPCTRGDHYLHRVSNRDLGVWWRAAFAICSTPVRLSARCDDRLGGADRRQYHRAVPRAQRAHRSGQYEPAICTTPKCGREMASNRSGCDHRSGASGHRWWHHSSGLRHSVRWNCPGSFPCGWPRLEGTREPVSRTRSEQDIQSTNEGTCRALVVWSGSAQSGAKMTG